MNFVELPFVKAFLLMIRDTLDFRGRTSRSNFWWATLGVSRIIRRKAFTKGRSTKFMICTSCHIAQRHPSAADIIIAMIAQETGKVKKNAALRGNIARLEKNCP